MNHFTGIIGICALLGIAYLLSENKKAINYRTVMWGLVLQFVFAVLILTAMTFDKKYMYIPFVGIFSSDLLLEYFNYYQYNYLFSSLLLW